MQSSRLPACARIGRSGTPYATLSDGMLASDSDGLPVALSFEDTLAMPDFQDRSFSPGPQSIPAAAEPRSGREMVSTQI